MPMQEIANVMVVLPGNRRFSDRQVDRVKAVVHGQFPALRCAVVDPKNDGLDEFMVFPIIGTVGSDDVIKPFADAPDREVLSAVAAVLNGMDLETTVH